MPVDLSFYVDTTEGVISPAPVLDALQGIMISNNSLAPAGTVLSFASVKDVGSYFGYQSKEYKAAQVYFGGFTESNKNPSQLYVTGLPTPDQNTGKNGTGATFSQNAFVNGYSLGVNPDINAFLAQLNNVTDKTLSFNFDATQFEAKGLDFSSCKSFSDIALAITTALAPEPSALKETTQNNENEKDEAQETASLLAPASNPSFTLSWSAKSNSFILNVNGMSIIQSAFDNVSGGLATVLGLSKNAGGIFSDFLSESSFAQIFDNLLLSFPNWFVAAFTFDATTFWLDAVNWGNQQKIIRCFSISDTTPNLSKLPAGQSIAEKAESSELSAIFWDNDTLEDGTYTANSFLVLAYGAASNFTGGSPGYTLAYRTQPGIIKSVNDTDTARNLEAKGYNFVCYSFGVDISGTWVWSGSVTGIFDWADQLLFNIWLTLSGRSTIISLLSTSAKLPYVASTNTLLKKMLQPVISDSIAFEGIVAGVSLDPQEQTEITQQVGDNGEAASSVVSNGYYISVKMQDVAPGDRAKRQTAPITIFYTSGGALQRAQLSTVLVK